MFSVGVLLATVVVVTVLDGRGPVGVWQWIPTAAAAVALLALPFSTAVAAAGGIVFGLALGLGLLAVPDSYVGGESMRSPDSVTEARVLGAGVLVLTVLAAGALRAWLALQRLQADDDTGQPWQPGDF